MISVVAAKASSVDGLLWGISAIFLGLTILRFFRVFLPEWVSWLPGLSYLLVWRALAKNNVWLSSPFVNFALIGLGLVFLASFWERKERVGFLRRNKRLESAQDIHTATLLVAVLFFAVAALSPAEMQKTSSLVSIVMQSFGGFGKSSLWLQLLPQTLFGLGASGAIMVTLLSWRFLAEPASNHSQLLQWLRQSHLWAAVFWTGLMLFYWLRGWSGNPQQTLRVVLLLVVFVGLLQPWQRRLPSSEGSHERWGLSPMFLLWCWIEGGVTAMVLMVELFALG